MHVCAWLNASMWVVLRGTHTHACVIHYIYIRAQAAEVHTHTYIYTHNIYTYMQAYFQTKCMHTCIDMRDCVWSRVCSSVWYNCWALSYGGWRWHKVHMRERERCILYFTCVTDNYFQKFTLSTTVINGTNCSGVREYVNEEVISRMWQVSRCSEVIWP